jgi:hypothetical protein
MYNEDDPLGGPAQNKPPSSKPSPEAASHNPPVAPPEGGPAFGRKVNRGELSDAEVEAMTLEGQLYAGETVEQHTRRVFQENAVRAAQEIVNLSQWATSERVRLDAAKYVTERVIGPVGKEAEGEEAAPWEDLYKDVKIPDAEKL